MSTAGRNVMGAVIGLVVAGIVIAIVEGNRGGLLVVAFMACMTFAFYSFARLLYLQLTLHRYKKPDATWSAMYSLYPYRIPADSLSEQGRRNLGEIWKCYVLFAGSILLPFILHGLLW
jgi:hypothetical protein